MGFFDKKSSSTTNLTETVTTETYGGADNRIAGDGSIIGGNINARNVGSITTTDYGAIDASLGITRDAIDLVGNQTANAFMFADTTNERAFNFGNNAIDAVSQSNDNIAGLASQAFTDLTGLASSVSGSANAALSNAVGKISEVVKRANESDSVEIWRIAALGAAAVAIFYMMGKK